MYQSHDSSLKSVRLGIAVTSFLFAAVQESSEGKRSP
jgi:hypothetical protein